MDKQKIKATAEENNGSEKRVIKKISKAAENLHAEVSRTRKREGAGLNSGTRKLKFHRAVEIDVYMLKIEFKEVGTIGDPTEPVNPSDSDDKKKEETLVEKAGTLDNAAADIGPNDKYLKSVEYSHVKEFVSACR